MTTIEHLHWHSAPSVPDADHTVLHWAEPAGPGSEVAA